MNNKRTSIKNDSETVGHWRFRREITLGTLVHLGAILIMLAVGWSNLQRELALIRRDLNQLIQTGSKLQSNVDALAEQGREHEYRLRTLESGTAGGNTADRS